MKAQLTGSIHERDTLAHKLDQSEKANADLVYSTSHHDSSVEEGGVIKLQL